MSNEEHPEEQAVLMAPLFFCFAENLPLVSYLLLLLSNLLTSEFSAVKGMFIIHLQQPKFLYVSINKCKIQHELMRRLYITTLKYWNCSMHRCIKIMVWVWLSDLNVKERNNISQMYFGALFSFSLIVYRCSS